MPRAQYHHCPHAPSLFGASCKQEHKTEAIASGAVPALVRLLDGTNGIEVVRLSCQAIESLALVATGRAAIAEAGGVHALNAALKLCPDAAVRALWVRDASICSRCWLAFSISTACTWGLQLPLCLPGHCTIQLIALPWPGDESKH
jgi:hypothetical protein